MWERVWKNAEGEEKTFYQGLIQAAAALLDIQRGNSVGARLPQCTASAPRSPPEAIEVVIASIRARFGDGAIGLGGRGIRFAEAIGEGVSHARTA